MAVQSATSSCKKRRVLRSIRPVTSGATRNNTIAPAPDGGVLNSVPNLSKGNSVMTASSENPAGNITNTHGPSGCLTFGDKVETQTLLCGKDGAGSPFWSGSPVGTGAVPYEPTCGKRDMFSPHSHMNLQSISAMPQFQEYSHEELRYSDLLTSKQAPGFGVTSKEASSIVANSAGEKVPVDSTFKPHCETSNAPYQVTHRIDGSTEIRMQSISAMPQYQDKSHEEIRFDDFMQRKANEHTGNVVFEIGKSYCSLKSKRVRRHQRSRARLAVRLGTARFNTTVPPKIYVLPPQRAGLRASKSTRQKPFIQGSGYDRYLEAIGLYRDEIPERVHRAPNPNNVPLSGVGSFLPKLTNPGYEVSPSNAELSTYTEAALATVRQFSVSRPGYGKVEWEGAVDVRNADLDSILVIDDKKVSIYESHEVDCSTPEIGTKLNRPAIISFERFFPSEGKRASSTVEDNFVEKAKMATRLLLAEFVSYDSSAGIWKIRVHHAGTYSLADVTNVKSISDEEIREAELAMRAITVAISRPNSLILENSRTTSAAVSNRDIQSAQQKPNGNLTPLQNENNLSVVSKGPESPKPLLPNGLVLTDMGTCSFY